jgi:hypothetical protein
VTPTHQGLLHVGEFGSQSFGHTLNSPFDCKCVGEAQEVGGATNNHRRDDCSCKVDEVQFGA